MLDPLHFSTYRRNVAFLLIYALMDLKKSLVVWAGSQESLEDEMCDLLMAMTA